MQWSDQQNAIFDAFRTGRSNFFVVARAGTGKSTTAAEGIRVAREKKKAYVVFARRNKKDFEERVGKDCKVVTCHGIGFAFVLKNWPGVVPDSQVEYDRIKKAVSWRMPSKLSSTPYQTIREILSFAKNTQPFAKLDDIKAMVEARGWDLDKKAALAGWTLDDCSWIAFTAFEDSKTRDSKNRISYDDQIWLPVAMNWVLPWYDLVVVDESQDLNFTQLMMIDRLYKASGRVCYIGDPRQAIFGFRGADTGSFDRLQKKLNPKIYPLNTTYRCPQKVVAIAKKLVPDYQVDSSAPQGEIVCKPIESLPDLVKPGELVMSRTNAPLMPLCLGLLKKGVRAYIEGRDIGMALAAIHEKIKTPHLTTYFRALDDWSSAKIQKLSGESDSEQRKNQLTVILDQANVLRALAEESRNVDEIGTRLQALFLDSENITTPAVVFSSIHKAKGTEYSNTYILYSTVASITVEETPSEMRNLLYVAITRCKQKLTWLTGPGEIVPDSLCL